MGVDLAELTVAAEKFDRAESILGWSVLENCRTGDNLSRTLYTQPCLYVVECILVDLLQARGQQPDAVAGHSLGEYVALYAAGVFDFDTGLKLVKRRSELMDAAAGGQMAALMKFDRSQLEAAVAETEGVVLANDNSPAQVVVSGTEEGIQTLLGKVKVRRTVTLDVSGAFHSPFMNEAAQSFQSVLDPVTFASARVPVLSNVDPTPETQAEALKKRLERQITGSVRWREISLTLPEIGIERVVEVGPGKVLSGLIGRTSDRVSLTNVGTLDDLNNIATAISAR